MKKHLRIQNHQVIRKKTQEKVVEPICGKITLPKEYIKTQNLINVPNLITQSKAPAPKNKYWFKLMYLFVRSNRINKS